jgi:hypothetical protein
MYRGFTMGLGVLKSCVISLTVACLVIFWGCAAVVETREEPETAVTKGVEDQENRVKTRVHEYWGYKIKRDFEKSYLYESPEYRKEVKLVDYLKSFGPGVEWLGAEVDRVEVAGDQATVLVKVRYRWTMVSAGPKEGITSTTKEKWRNVNSIWYHVRKVRKTLITPKNLDSERR